MDADNNAIEHLQPPAEPRSMLAAVERAMEIELRWPRSIIRQLEDVCPGRGLQWAADRVRRWIVDTKPDGQDELLRLITIAEEIGLSASDSTALAEESKRIWYLFLKDVYPQRAVCRLYEALAELARGNRDGYMQSLATAVFIAAASENYTEEMFRELQNSCSDLMKCT